MPLESMNETPLRSSVKDVVASAPIWRRGLSSSEDEAMSSSPLRTSVRRPSSQAISSTCRSARRFSLAASRPFVSLLVTIQDLIALRGSLTKGDRNLVASGNIDVVLDARTGTPADRPSGSMSAAISRAFVCLLSQNTDIRSPTRLPPNAEPAER